MRVRTLGLICEWIAILQVLLHLFTIFRVNSTDASPLATPPHVRAGAYEVCVIASILTRSSRKWERKRGLGERKRMNINNSIGCRFIHRNLAIFITCSHQTCQIYSLNIRFSTFLCMCVCVRVKSFYATTTTTSCITKQQRQQQQNNDNSNKHGNNRIADGSANEAQKKM